MLAELIIYLIMAVLGIMSTIAVYLAIKERDLVKAVVYSALQSGFYAVLYYFLMAPDIVLVYLPVAVGLVPGVLLILISKTERWEKNEAS
ncbi:MAG: hydrogenase subunit MbhD domain-containing protein [Desulfurococcaceae archaeon]